MNPFEPLKHLTATGLTDPLKYYFHPLVGGLYRQRISMGLRCLDNSYDNLLEIGYGCGFLMPYWSTISRRVHGLDLDSDPFVVSTQLRQLTETSFELQRGNLLEMPYEDETFDCVVAFSILEHIADREKAVSEIKRVLVPGGVTLVGIPAVNKMMDYAFKAIGFNNINDHHVTTPKHFFQTASRHLTLRKKKAMPALVPIPLALYNIFLFEKPSSLQNRSN